MDGYIGEIRLFAPNFAPRSWAFCNGQLLLINQNQALFSILGTYYGGNGVTTFALPDLRSKTAIGVGQGPGLSNYNIGQVTGSAATTLNASQLPPHTHTTVTGTIKMPTTSQPADSESPVGNYFANDGSNKFDPQNDGVTMKPANVNLAAANLSNSTPVNNMMPYLAINYIICLQGYFPSRN